MSVATSDENGPDARETADDGVSIGWVVTATVVCTLVVIAGHGLLYFAFVHNWTRTRDEVPFVWQPVVGSTLGVIALFSFGMFYAAARRARVAITASFILTFLAALTFVLTVPAFAGETIRQGTTGLFNDFRSLLNTIVIAYFTAEGAITVTKVVSTARANSAGSNPRAAQAIRRADVDLPLKPRKAARRSRDSSNTVPQLAVPQTRV